MAADRAIYHLKSDFFFLLLLFPTNFSSGTGSPPPLLCSQLLAVQPGMLQQEFGMCLSAGSFDLSFPLLFKDDFPLLLT